MRQPGTRAKRAVPIATQPLTPPQPRPQHTTLGPRVSVLRICSTQLCLPSIGRSHFCVSFVSSGSEVLCVVFFNLFVFIFGGGILNKFIAVRYPSLVLEISFYLGSWAQRVEEGQMEPGAGQESTVSPAGG